MTLPSITINYRAEVATNTTTGATCDIIRKDSTWYTSISGLSQLENGLIEPHNLRSNLAMARKRKSKRYQELLKPIEFNGLWLYSVVGWMEYRNSLVKPKENS